MDQHIKELQAILEHATPDELFSNGFMVVHTDFKTIDAMLLASGFQGIKDLLSEQGSAFIAEHTAFRDGGHFFVGAKSDWLSRQSF